MCFQVYVGASQECPEIPYAERLDDRTGFPVWVDLAVTSDTQQRQLVTVIRGRADTRVDSRLSARQVDHWAAIPVGLPQVAHSIDRPISNPSLKSVLLHPATFVVQGLVRPIAKFEWSCLLQ